MANFKAAKRYSTAFYEVAEESGITDAALNDFIDIKKSLDSSHELRLFLESPIINPEKKLLIVKIIFQDKVNEITLKFLLLLCEKNRINILKEVSETMIKLIFEKRGIAEAFITTSIEITDSEKDSILKKLQQYSGKKISSVYLLDKAIKGGFIAQVGDKIIDASISRQLELLKEKLQNGSFNN